MRGIIIDGVAASGKTSVLKYLQKKILEDKFSSSKLFISEHYTQRMLEDLVESEKISGLMVRRHTSRIIRSLEVYQEMLDKSKFADDPRGAEIFVTLERFTLTYLATKPPLAEDFEFEKAAKQFQALKKLGIRQYILTLSPKQIKNNVALTLKHRNKVWISYIESHGGLTKAVNYFIEWQDNLLYFADKFKDYIDTKTINTDNSNYSELALHIFNTVYANQER